jgi:L-threonylcarbamoyladenylate synthase
MSPWRLKRLGKALNRGAVIAYPTDTIWGLGCHPLSSLSVSRILSIKQRPWTKGLILLSSELEYCMPYISADLTQPQLDKLTQTTVNPITWLVPAHVTCPLWIKGRFPTVAIRITRHPFVKALCTQIQSPIVSTSANRAGLTPIRNSIQAHRQFAGMVDYIVSGFSLGTGRPSEIKSIETNVIIRSATNA